MRQINRRTDKLSGNYKRHLKKVSHWDHERNTPLEKGWVGQRRQGNLAGLADDDQIQYPFCEDKLELVDGKEENCEPEYAKCLACEKPDLCERKEE